MPIIIGTSNQKGGVGKSTSVVNMAVGLQHLGQRVVIYDIDTQESIVDWKSACKESKRASLPKVVNTSPGEITRDKILTSCANYDYVIIDGPAGAKDLDAQRIIISVSDILLIPVEPSPITGWSTSRFMKMVVNYKQQEKPDLVIKFMAVQITKRENMSKDLIEHLQKTKFGLLDHHFNKYKEYKYCLKYGGSIFDEKNKKEIENVKLICSDIMNLTNTKIEGVA